MEIIEPAPAQYEAEYRYGFQAVSPPGPHVIVQGSVGVTLMGNENDEADNEYDVHLLVGPFWGYLQEVVPSVTVNGFWNSNADEDDEQKWDLTNLTWDSVGEFGPNNDELRIRLKFHVAVRGEESRVRRLGYYLIARGRQLGAGGLNEPGPVKQQG